MIERMRLQQEKHEQQEQQRQIEVEVEAAKAAENASGKVAGSVGTSNKKKGKRGKPGKDKAVQKTKNVLPTPPPSSPLMVGQLQLEAERSLCRGIFRLCNVYLPCSSQTFMWSCLDM